MEDNAKEVKAMSVALAPKNTQANAFYQTQQTQEAPKAFGNSNTLWIPQEEHFFDKAKGDTSKGSIKRIRDRPGVYLAIQIPVSPR